VLRARVGQEFDLIANGIVRRGRVSTIKDDRVEFELGEEIAQESPPVNLTLLLAVFKFDRMEWAIEKATELGVSRIIPLIARRTDSHLASAAEKRVERWRRIAVQASEQSRRAISAAVTAPMKLRDVIGVEAATKIVLSEAEQQTSLREILGGRQNASDAMLAVGPEGGWTQDELDLFAKNGWIPVSLGPTILRVETAAIAAVAISMSQLR
jgi:16S rRNA (uracil1498-N3)-methyltransferase